MKRSDFKQVLLAFFVVLILSLSYLFFLYMYKYSISKKDNLDDIEIKYNSINSVELKDTLPLSDKIGRTISYEDIDNNIEGYIEFSISNKTNKSVNYEIYIIRNESKNEIDTRFVKMYLSDSDGNPLGIYNKNFSPTYYSLNYIDDFPEAKSVYKGTIDGMKKENFIFRAWVSDGYSFQSKEKIFNFSIGVRTL